MPDMKKVALRIDDIGSSSKKFEVYSNKWAGFGNILFLKKLKFFRAWGPYREMDRRDWEEVLTVLDRFGAKLTVAVTACWVEYNGDLVPFHDKFPDAAGIIKEGVRRGLLEIANHGLTHCVLESYGFRPRLFTSNRKFHREFWDWIPRETQFEHLRRSQEILEQSFGEKSLTFVPSGNVYSRYAVEAAKAAGIKTINSVFPDDVFEGIRFVSNDNVVAFHDKDIVENGTAWFESLISGLGHPQFVFVSDLA